MSAYTYDMITLFLSFLFFFFLTFISFYLVREAFLGGTSGAQKLVTGSPVPFYSNIYIIHIFPFLSNFE